MPHSDIVTLCSGSIQTNLQMPPKSRILKKTPDFAASQEASRDCGARITESLRKPVDLPALSECVVPGDRVVIAVDPETPVLSEIVTRSIEELLLVGQEGVHITLLLPPDPSGSDWSDVRSLLPVHVQQKLLTLIHDPQDETQYGYLASSAGGDRIYLNRILLDADLIITIGTIGFDSVLGYQGTTSVLYPAMSDAATIQQGHGTGHPELTPEQSRPMRTLIDEIGWLLGTQLAVQVIPDGNGMVDKVLAGMPERVQQDGQQVLNEAWRFTLKTAYDLIVISVPAHLNFGWKQIGAAVEAVCPIVRQGGRIAIIADVGVPDGPAASMLRRCAEPEDLLKPLRREPTSDAREISQLITAQQRARIYLRSSLASEIVEELGMFALESNDELQRLVNSSGTVAVLPGANYSWCEIQS
jgi:nickel-dependent lactate racemase